MIASLLIKDFPRRIKLSERRMKRYFEKDRKKKIPVKYQNSKYEWKKFSTKKSYLIEKKSGDKVIANPKVWGTPKFQVISGQDILSMNMHHMTRNKIMQSLHEFFIESFIENGLKPFKEEDFPLRISGELFIPYYEQKGNDWDVDNLQLPYVKAFHDALTLGGFIPDDHRGFISEPLHFRYTPSENYKMVIKFEKDKRKLWKKIYEKHGF